MEPTHTSELLTIGEVAHTLGVSVETVRRWADSGRIPVIVLPSGHRRFRREDVAALVERRAS